MGQPLWWELFRIQLGIAAKATTSATLWLAASRLSLEEMKLLHARILQSWTLAPFLFFRSVMAHARHRFVRNSVIEKSALDGELCIHLVVGWPIDSEG